MPLVKYLQHNLVSKAFKDNNSNVIVQTWSFLKLMVKMVDTIQIYFAWMMIVNDIYILENEVVH